MLSVKFIREHQKEVKRAILLKVVDLDLDELFHCDHEKRDILTKVEGIRAERNKTTAQMGKSLGSNDLRQQLVEKGKQLKGEIKALELALKEADQRLNVLLFKVPNIVSPDTPEGKTDEENIEIFRCVGIPNFGFVPKDHIQLGQELDVLDFERGIKVAGYRGYYIKNEGVSLMLGFLMYAMSKMVAKGYSLRLVPTIVKDFVLFGSGHFKGEKYDSGVDEIYQVVASERDTGDKVEKKFLVGTAEPSLLAYYTGEVLREEQLPLKVCGFSQCYRSEIGSHGKDTKGLYRVHEFMKVEQVVIARADIEESVELQNQMVEISSQMHEELGIPYRRLQICSGGMGIGKYRMFDIEAWMPGLNRWGETGSASNFLDWQARRLNVRYETLSGEKKYVFMLNNTALPSPRIFIALLENHQQEDGSVMVPEVIKPFMPIKFDAIKRK